jgi:hypothetical protein
MTPIETMDALGAGLANGALTTLVRLFPAIREANESQRERACVAMRAKTREVVDQMLDDTKAAPWLAQAHLQLAIVTLAQEGIRVLKAEGVDISGPMTGTPK